MSTTMKPTQFLNIAGVQIAIYQKGTQGIPVIFIHGNSLSAETFIGQFESDLLNEFRLIAIDLPGHGLSAKPDDPEKVYLMPFFIRIVSEVIEQLKLDSVIVVGNSMGGHIAMESLTQEPKIAGIFIFGAPALSKPLRMNEAYLPEPATGYLFKPDVLTEEELDILSQRLLAQPAEEKVTEIIKEALQSADFNIRIGVGNIVASGNYYDEEEILRTSKVPVAIVQGEEELFVNLAYLQQLAIPNLWRKQVQLIPQANHCPQLEQPTVFNELLRAFISDVYRH